MKKIISTFLFLVMLGMIAYSQDKAAQFDNELKKLQTDGVLRIEGNKLIFKTNYPSDSAQYIKKYQPWISDLHSPYTMAFEPKHAVEPPGPPSNRLRKDANGQVISPRDPASGIIAPADSAIIGPVDSKGKLAPPPPGIKGNTSIAKDSSVNGYRKLAPPPPGNRKLAPPPPGNKNLPPGPPNNVIRAKDSLRAPRS